MEIAAVGISAVSLIALFDTVIEGYKLLRSAAQDLPRDGRFLVNIISGYGVNIWALHKMRNASLYLNYRSRPKRLFLQC